MSFQEKSSWAMLVTVALVYGAYFVIVAGEVDGTDVADVDYQPLMLVTVVVLVIVAIIAHAVIAAANPREAEASDERDKEINWYGEYIGGYALAVGTLVGLGLAMAEAEPFWIANVLLLGLVVSELVAGATKVALYRRGF
ncbi:MAG: hypothetical protein QNJ71_10875 [Acidimicrobiia bacterium]|nr:hypothetical protein [Acidimicrobiia bacterium]